MKNYLVLIILTLSSCNSEIKKDEFIGVWINEKEKCKIQLNNDLTFVSTNLPLDVRNKYYLMFGRDLNTWQGVWLLENNQLKLTLNGSYYYLDVNTNLLSEKHRLYVELLDESGGNRIYFDKQ